MKQVVLSIPNNKFNIFIEFIKQIHFVKISSPEHIALSTLSRKRKFTIMSVNKKKFEFNRDELNER